MSAKSISISSAWSSLMRQEKRRERLVEEQGVSFDALYSQYYAAIFAFLHFLVGTPEVAEDLASPVFEKVWMHLADVQSHEMAGPGSFVLLAIAPPIISGGTSQSCRWNACCPRNIPTLFL